MYCADFGDYMYLVPGFTVGAVGFACAGGSILPVQITRVIRKDSDESLYNTYCDLPEDERDEYIGTEESCEFILDDTCIIVGFKYPAISDLIEHYC